MNILKPFFLVFNILELNAVPFNGIIVLLSTLSFSIVSKDHLNMKQRIGTHSLPGLQMLCAAARKT